MPLKIGFYPCCGADIKVPLLIMRNYVDKVIFCDTNPRRLASFKKIKLNLPPNLPESSLLIADANEVISQLDRIDVFFYRCDGVGEGGSGVIALGNRFLDMVIKRMPNEGGLIITDGSNSRQSNFERMSRPQGVFKFGRKLEPHPNNDLLTPPDCRSYHDDQKLRVVVVKPFMSEIESP